MRILLSSMLLFVVWSSGAAQAAVNMQEGNWETTVDMKMEGMPFPMPPTTYRSTQCLTRKDMVPSTAEKDQKCEIKSQKVSGNTVTWTVICRDEDGTSEGRGEITYSGTTYQGVVKTTVRTKGDEEPIRTTMKMKGKRLGNCPK